MKYLLFLMTAGLAMAQTPKGIWDATVVADTREIAFQMRFETHAGKLRAAVMDGDRPIWSTSAVFTGGKLSVKWDFYDAGLEAATLTSGELRGTYTRRTKRGPVHRLFAAKPAAPVKAGKAESSPFLGDWVLTPADGGAGAKAHFQMAGGRLTGTILRVDGDFGTLAGAVDGDKAALTHFDLVRATHVQMEIDGQGNLSGVIDGKTKFTGVREGASMPDPSQVTRVRDPKEPFQFFAKDLDGKPVTLADSRFKGKAVLITVMGSWCPNCHDEAPFLAELYRKYGSKGFEVVALAFEYTGDPAVDIPQVRAFVRRHGVPYMTLLAGSTDDGQVQKALPQLVNFSAYPSSMIVDRLHRIVAIHAGFAGPATGSLHTELKQRITAEVEQALAAR
ncbi:MAG TPA: TlpA disulfide reductase family protein [Bryobacteraceae bacterium]|nr:TlpA disulfide reductase family protein [Bryobacteraceae bacterium]